MKAMAEPKGSDYDYQVKNGSGYQLGKDGSYLPI